MSGERSAVEALADKWTADVHNLGSVDDPVGAGLQDAYRACITDLRAALAEDQARAGQGSETVYDEDGYCVHCGNGSWKPHAPECVWADLRDAVMRARIETAALLGWSTFGTHVDQPGVLLEFAGESAGFPEFERVRTGGTP